MSTVSSRLKYFFTAKKLNQVKVSEDLSIDYNALKMQIHRNSIKEAYIDMICNRYGVSKQWLLTGEGDMITDAYKGLTIETPSGVSIGAMGVSEPYVIDSYTNKNANTFLILPNGQYLMTMPLAEYDVQAGFLDVYQDVERLGEMRQHSIMVDKPVHGKYIAFRVRGNSMDDGSSNSIQENDIVSTRELQRHHWSSKLRFKDFPYWVIFTSTARTPLIKEIVDHDVEKGTITCHSLNDSPDYHDFKINVDDIRALFYVVRVQKEINDGIEY